MPFGQEFAAELDFCKNMAEKIHLLKKENIPTLTISQGSEKHFQYDALESVFKNQELNDEMFKKPHRHDYFSIFWILEGEGSHTVEFNKFKLEKNQIYLIQPGQMHYFDLTDVQMRKLKGHSILFSSDFLESYGIPLSFRNGLLPYLINGKILVAKPNEKETNKLTYLVNEMIEEYRSEQLLKMEQISALIKSFLIINFRIESENNTPETITENIKSNDAVERFLKLLEKNYTELHMVSDYANLLSLTPNYLNEIVKANTGKSPKDLIQDRIILQAKRFIAYTDNTLKEIAFKLGFSEPTHFSKFFKSHTGHSFKEYKENLDKQK